MQNRKPSKSERAALHETGHAFVARRLCWVGGEIALPADGQEIDRHTLAGSQRPSPNAWESLLFASGGIVAEAIQLGLPPRHALREAIRLGTRDGQTMACHLHGLVNEGSRELALDEAADLVAGLLREEWDDLLRVAEELQTNGRCNLRPLSHGADP